MIGLHALERPPGDGIGRDDEPEQVALVLNDLKHTRHESGDLVLESLRAGERSQRQADRSPLGNESEHESLFVAEAVVERHRAHAGELGDALHCGAVHARSRELGQSGVENSGVRAGPIRGDGDPSCFAQRGPKAFDAAESTIDRCSRYAGAGGNPHHGELLRTGLDQAQRRIEDALAHVLRGLWFHG